MMMLICVLQAKEEIDLVKKVCLFFDNWYIYQYMNNITVTL